MSVETPRTAIAVSLTVAIFGYFCQASTLEQHSTDATTEKNLLFHLSSSESYAPPVKTAYPTSNTASKQSIAITSNPSKITTMEKLEPVSSSPTANQVSNVPSAGVISALVLLGVLSVALSAAVAGLAYFLRKQHKKMKSIGNRVAALDCHVKMHLALSREIRNSCDKDAEKVAVPALPEKTRKGSAPPYLERDCASNNYLYSNPRKQSLPISLQSRVQPFTIMENVQEENVSNTLTSPANYPKSFQSDMRLEIPAFNSPAQKCTENKRDYVNFKENGQEEDYENSFAHDSHDFNCHQLFIDVEDDYTDMKQPVYSNGEVA